MLEEIGFIEDGYEADGYIAKVPGVHRDLTFTYRPATAPERSAALKAIGREMQSPNAQKSELTAAKLLADKIVSWNMVRPSDGSEVKIAPENVARLHPEINQKLWEIIIMGSRANDDRPEEGAEKEKSATQKTGIEQEADDTKN